jgi:tRNA(Arg) A34 adenosine deaminase TadA
MSDVIIDKAAEQPPLTATAAQLARLLKCMHDEILPITTKQVAAGNKVFGAAVLDQDFKTVLAGSNQETECPLFHGEVKVIFEWSQKVPAAERGPAAKRSVFLATHEPCCMCISSIVWAGFSKCYYLFPYAVTAAQGIPHDINTMHELWGVQTYRKVNKYIATASIMELIEQLDEDSEEKKALQDQVERLIADYDALSNKYHSEKADNKNNSLVLG